jgi:hypothetical protein
MAETPKKHEFHGYDHGARTRPQLALPQPCQQGAVAVDGEKTVAKHQAQDDKMSALRTFRRARGLCDFCAKKWFHGHKCALTIPLQAMQGIWDLFQLEEFSEPTEEDQAIADATLEHLFLALSQDAQQGVQGRQTIQFLGSVQGLMVTVLVDSRSSASFLAESVASQL